MTSFNQFAADARVTVHRRGTPDSLGRCVVYWMQRAQRGRDNPALNVAIEVANLLRKPVVAMLGRVPFYPHANLRSYTFLVQEFRDIAQGLLEKNVGFVLLKGSRTRHLNLDLYVPKASSVLATTARSAGSSITNRVPVG
jgi:deoxyribodipyrimidine photo-lyase